MLYRLLADERKKNNVWPYKYIKRNYTLSGKQKKKLKKYERIFISVNDVIGETRFTPLF